MRMILGLSTVCLTAGLAVPVMLAQPAPAQAPRARSAAVALAETPYLGIGGQDLTEERAKALKLKDARGVELTNVYPDSAAAKAGLQKGDVVLEFNGQKVEGWEQMRRLVRETPIHREVKVTIWRNSAAQTLNAVVGAQPASMLELGGNTFMIPELNKMEEMPMPRMDMPQLRTFIQNRNLGIYGEGLGQDAQFAEFFGVKDGVLIRNVTKGSPAEKAGIKAGDVITKIDDTAVSSPQEITKALRTTGAKRNLTVTVVRNKKEMTLNVTMESGAPYRGGVWTLGGPETDGFLLQFAPNHGVIQGAKEGAPKILWQ